MLFSQLIRRALAASKGFRRARPQPRRTADRRRIFLEQLEDRRVLANLVLAAVNADRTEGSSGNTLFTFSVSRDVATSTSSVQFDVTGSGANPASGSDFTGGGFPSGIVSFAVNELSKNFTVSVIGDTVPEFDEGFTVTLSNPSAGDTITTGTATGTIQNDDGAVPSATLAIAADQVILNEGNSGTTNFTFTVTRGGDTSGTSTVDFAVSPGSPPAGPTDFTGGVLPTGTLTFAPGQTSQVITIGVSGDTTVEAAERFNVTLLNPSAPDTITTATAQSQINNDDITPSGTVLAIATTAAQSNLPEGNSGSTPFTFTVTRGGDTTGTTTATFTVAGNGANPANGTDFTGGAFPTGTVTFTAGQTSQTITVNVSGDTTIEPNEGFAVFLTNPSAPAVISTDTAFGTIQNDDPVAGTTLAIAAADASKAEGNAGTTPFTFTVTRSGDTSGATSVQFAVTGSGANPAAATDFGGVLPTGTVNFAAGETSQTITVNVSGDTIIESDEGFTVTLSNPSAPATITTAAAAGTILNDDSALAINATDAAKAEGNAGSTPFTFTVTRIGDTSGTASVNFAVSGSGANPADAADFGGVLPTGTVTFTAGSASQTITINVSGDTAVELNEDFDVVLSGASPGSTIVTGIATGTILNDDAAAGTTLDIAATDATKAEGNAGSTAFTFTVTRSGDTSGTGSVNFAVTGSGANPAAASDFTGGVLPTGTLNFTAGQASQTITVNVSGDTAVEPDEGFTVTLSNPSSPSTINTATAVGTILNDDAAAATSLAVTAIDANKPEGDAGTTPFTFNITRSGDTTGTTSVNFAVTGSGANPANGADIVGGVLPTGTAIFSPGQTSMVLTVNVAGDTIVEPNEGFTVTLSGATGGATITTPTASGTIINDDVAAAINLAIAATDATKLEGDAGSTAFTFTVTRSGDTSGATSVNFAVTGSGASPASASDFTGGLLPTGTVNFLAGQTSQTVTVNVNGDTAVELDEGFTVTLSGATGGATITTATAAGLILNDDAVTPPEEGGIEIITANAPGEPGTAEVVDDADNPGQGALIVTGTSKNDVIIIEPRHGHSDQIRVLRNGKVIGTFNKDEVQTIVAFGLAGNDTIIVNAKLNIPALLFGDSGNDKLFGAKANDGLDGGTGSDKLYGISGHDRLVGGDGNDSLFGASGNDELFGQAGNDSLFGDSGNDIVVGGTGNDKVHGGSGRDVLIGGTGRDTLYGESGDDLLISDETAFDEDGAALAAILAEWTSSNSFAIRVENLALGGGENADVVLDDTTIFDDGDVDTLFGGSGQDWFIIGSGDRVRDKSRSDRVN